MDGPRKKWHLVSACDPDMVFSHGGTQTATAMAKVSPLGQRVLGELEQSTHTLTGKVTTSSLNRAGPLLHC